MSPYHHLLLHPHVNLSRSVVSPLLWGGREDEGKTISSFFVFVTEEEMHSFNSFFAFRKPGT